MAVCGDWLGVTDSTAPSCWFSIVSEASASASTDCFSADLQTPSDQLKHVCAVCFLKAHAQPCMRYYGKHIFSNCIMKQNANMMQVCEFRNRVFKPVWSEKNKMSVDKLQFAFGFPFFHKSHFRPNQLTEIISIPKFLLSLNIDFKKTFSYIILFSNGIVANFCLLDSTCAGIGKPL